MTELDITEFLTARYDEDEAAELARLDRFKTLRRALKESAARIGADTPPPEPTPDPRSRVLADIAAKRRRLERHRDFDFPANEDDGPGNYAWTPHCDSCHQPWPCFELRNDASVYADRPGYKPEWAV